MKMLANTGLITQAEFLHRAGLRASRFRQLKAEGLPLVGKRVDYEQAVVWMKANLDQARKDNWQNGSLNDLRRERARVKIDQQKLELAKARGELIERKAVKKFLAERARMERDSWLAWASAVSARIAASLSVDHGKLFVAMDDEVRAQLRYIADKPTEDG
ncbi:MAG: hypothetical protein ACREDO_01540 [Methyloceanibacter sp.]